MGLTDDSPTMQAARIAWATPARAQQPIRLVEQRIVSCDGGGGPLGHPKIFINLDKPQINWCTYCGVPFANEHHRKHIEALPNPSYPLESTGDAAEVQESQRITDEPLGHR